jgi:hypothetical protein
MPKIYDSGDLVRIHATFVASGGVMVDPATVYMFVRNPQGSVASYGYPAQIQKSGIGGYYLDVLASAPGDFAYRAFGTPSAGLSAAEGIYSVSSSFVL